ncbi:hypothetical protein [Nonomuraea sp. NPDC049784]|uniref:hypothetical protein n=1 Tax=Nonomuraea sp. NPDC049784 TaxID=3154361 RepID=UPI0033E0D3F8
MEGSVDDALDLLISTRLPAGAEREPSKEKLRTLPRVERAPATPAEAVRVLVEATDDQIGTATGEVLTPGPASVGGDRAGRGASAADRGPVEAIRAHLAGRFAMVRPFLPRR